MNFRVFGHVLMTQDNLDMLTTWIIKLGVYGAFMTVAFFLMAILALIAIRKYRALYRAMQESGIVEITTIS